MEVINLNLIPSGALPVVHASQYDEGRTFRANLMDGSTVYTLDGTEVLECDVKKPDGNIVTVAVTNTSDSYVEIDTTLQMCACAGESLAELHITKGAQEIGTLNFLLAVERSPLEGGIQSDSGIHNLQTQIGEAVAEQYAAEDVVFDAAPVAGHGTGFAVTSEGVKTYVEGEIAALTIPEELDDLQNVELTSPTAGEILEYDDNDGKWKNVANPASTTNFGAPYDENTTYNVPSLVIENNLLFKLNEGEVDVTGPFDPTKWTQTSLAELTAEDFPLSSTDPTPTSEAIGDLSQLTTSVTSSLVGAVNEVNGAITSPKDITSDYITMASGYTFTSGKVYKQGKHIFGNIVLSGTLQGGNNTDTLGTIKSDYRTADPINGFCGISNGQWFTNNIGYVYIASSGGLQVATTPTGMNYAKIHLDYITA